jgi:hypothetical protein
MPDDPTDARLVEQIADIIREFEKPFGSAEYPREAAVRIIGLVRTSRIGSLPCPQSLDGEG